MAWEFSNDTPIYMQIMDIIKCKIISGEYKPSDRIDAVRILATEAAVNPNTMQKALLELEKEGLLNTNRTKGRYVTDDAQIISNLKEKMVIERWEKLIAELSNLGLEKIEIEIFIKKKLDELCAD